MIKGVPGSVYDVGSIPRASHTRLSARKHFSDAGPSGARVSRVYANFRKQGSYAEGGAHIVHVINQPGHISIRKAQDTIPAFFLVEEDSELFRKLRR